MYSGLALASLGNQPGGGLIVAPDVFSAISRFARRGGLMSYGPSLPDAVKRAITYVDRILRGEKPAELPVQAPVKYDLAVNLKTATTLGLSIPESFLLRADEVIE